MIRLCFRFDDLSARSNHAAEARIFETFALHRIPLTVATVPYSQMGDDLVALRLSDVAHVMDAYRAGTVEIAQHGFAHARSGSTASGKPSEFAGVPSNIQEEWIDRGAECLARVFGVRPAGFVPPWNSYDETTAQLLAAKAYRYISAGWEMPARRDIVSVPRTTSLTELQSAMATARRFEFFSPAVVVVLHDYDFEESGEEGWRLNVGVLERLLAWVNEQRSVTISTIGTAVEQGLSSSLAVRWNGWRQRLPWRLRKLFPEAVILTNPFAA
jgi:peptidoglycan/xylan/chitin deacetylase (PgdA/CDA1 family)